MYGIFPLLVTFADFCLPIRSRYTVCNSTHTVTHAFTDDHLKESFALGLKRGSFNLSWTNNVKLQLLCRII